MRSRIVIAAASIVVIVSKVVPGLDSVGELALYIAAFTATEAWINNGKV